MKKLFPFLSLFCAICLSPFCAISAQEGNVFVFSPGPKEGLHLAVLDSGSWKDIGQVLSSDYGPWREEKKIITPRTYRTQEGGYIVLFNLGDTPPCFAVAYSDDLVDWRPQDYPRMSVRGCLEPVMSGHTVFFRTKEGKYRKTTADSDYRHFTNDEACAQTEYDAVRNADTTAVSVLVNGKERQGNIVTGDTERITAILSSRADHNRKAAQNMSDRGDYSTDARLIILADQSKTISDKLIGVFFEDISFAADGGLYAELIQNRDFEYSSLDRREWTALTAWRAGSDSEIATSDPLSANNPHYIIVSGDSLINSGWDGITLKNGAKYNFSLWARNIDGGGNNLRVLLAENGKIIAKDEIKTEGKEWKKYSLTLTAKSDAEKAELIILPRAKKSRTALDMISLFPRDTYKGRENGLRKDLAEAIANLHPRFIRFPGGCLTHGQGIGNIYHWGESVGPLQERKPAKNIWHYHQTRGLGFYEFFLFCEDIGAEPLPVLAAGVPCQNSDADSTGYAGQQGGIPMKDMPAYINELLHLIDWANGDPATNKWAKMRAEAGHPEPFNLKYIGIGNEDLISTVFEERYLMICQSIKEKHPEIKICGTIGPFHTPSSDYIEGWKIARANRDIIDMVDEHYYEGIGWFLSNQHYYDNYSAEDPKVYLGEYASHGNKADNALVEALYLCNIERNGDKVAMTSYAPLLCNTNHKNWNPDLIYFNNNSLTLSPSYYTQRLFSVYSGDQYVPSYLDTPDSLVNARLARSVVRDSESGKMYLRLVNTLSRDINVTIGGVSLPSSLSYDRFTGAPGSTSVECSQGTVNTDGNSRIVAPAYSCTVIDLTPGK